MRPLREKSLVRKLSAISSLYHRGDQVILNKGAEAIKITQTPQHLLETQPLSSQLVTKSGKHDQSVGLPRIQSSPRKGRGFPFKLFRETKAPEKQASRGQPIPAMLPWPHANFVGGGWRPLKLVRRPRVIKPHHVYSISRKLLLVEQVGKYSLAKMR